MLLLFLRTSEARKSFSSNLLLRWCLEFFPTLLRCGEKRSLSRLNLIFKNLRKTRDSLGRLFALLMILLANVLQSILHRVLLIAKIKISRYCSTVNFIQDYFRQQYLLIREQESNTNSDSLLLHILSPCPLLPAQVLFTCSNYK